MVGPIYRPFLCTHPPRVPIAVRVDRLLDSSGFFSSRTGYSVEHRSILRSLTPSTMITVTHIPYHFIFFRKIWTSLSKLLNCTYLVTGYRPSATLWEKFFDSLGHEH